jgi:hypothetical protein
LLLLDEQKRLFKSLPLLHLLDPNVVVVVFFTTPLESQLPFVFLCRQRSSKGCFSRHFFWDPEGWLESIYMRSAAASNAVRCSQ